ncbi:DUF551 domain-containing protein [Serratia inhibens]|uniref:DUF551 domain-containing protein n=1 Tax=Serratia inhibens TaxID=2338073 RepID=UPI00321713D3
MKELDQFTAEQLERYANPETLTIPPSHAQVAALARIALAAKTSQPVQWWTGTEPTLTGEMESFHDHETGSHFIPLIPALGSVNSPVIPDGWVACSERLPDDDEFVLVWPLPDFGVELHVGQYCECHMKGDGWYAQVNEQNYGIEWYPITVTHWMPLPAAPKPEK